MPMSNLTEMNEKGQDYELMDKNQFRLQEFKRGSQNMLDLEPLQGPDERHGDHSFKRGSTDQASLRNEEDDLECTSGYRAKRPPNTNK